MFLQGNDPAGKMIRADMEKLGVNTDLVFVDDGCVQQRAVQY